MSSLYDAQGRRLFLKTATSMLGLAALAGCGVSRNPLASDDTEAAGKTTSGILKRVRVYEAIHLRIEYPGSPVQALRQERVPHELSPGAPFVRAINSRSGMWVYAVDGVFPEGGRIMHLGSHPLVSPEDLLEFPRGSMQAELAPRTAPISGYSADSSFPAWPWNQTIISWFRVSLA